MGVYDGGQTPKADHDPQQSIQWDIAKIAQGIGQDLTAIVTQLIDAAIEAVQEWVTGLFGLITNPGAIIEMILTTLSGLGIEDALNLIGTNPLLFIPQMIANFIQNGLLGPGSPLSALNIFGMIPQWLIGLIPLGSITNTTPNLFANIGGFDTSDSIRIGTGWVWDNTTGRTTVGCAKVTANGTLFNRDLASLIRIPVVEGQVVHLSTWVKWAGMSYVGTNPISLGVGKYLSGVDLGVSVVASFASPAASQSTFVELAGDYTVPAGVDEIEMVFRQANTVSAGQAWFDDGSGTKPSDGLPQSWIIDLVPDLGALGDFIVNVIDAISSVIHGLPFGIGGILGDLFDDLTDWFEDTQNSAAQAGDALLIATTIEPVVYDTVDNVVVVQKKAVIQQNFSVSNITDSPRQPFWMSRHPISDVTFPEYMLNQFDLYGTTDGASAGTAHTHTLGLTNSPHSNVSGYGIANGNCRGALISIANTTVHDNLSVAIWKGAGTCTNVTLDLFYVRADGSAYQLFSTNVAASLTTTPQFLEVPLGFPLIVQAEDVYLIRVSNQSAAQVNVSALTELTGVQQGFATVGGGLNTLTSYTTAQMTAGRAATGLVSWCSMFRAAEFYTPKTYTDDFNRPGFGALWIPAGWIGGPGFLDIDFNAGEGRVAYGGTTNGDEANLYMYTTASDQSMVSADFWNLTGTGLVGSASAGILAHCTRDLSQMTYLGVNTVGVNLYAGAMGALGSAKATYAFANGAGDGINYGIYVDPTPTHAIFYIMQGDNDVASWTDSTDIMQKGLEYRYGGIRISRASGINGGNLDNWAMKDLA